MNPLYSLPELSDLKPSTERFSKLSYQIDKTLGVRAKDSSGNAKKQLQKMFQVEVQVPLYNKFRFKK